MECGKMSMKWYDFIVMYFTKIFSLVTIIFLIWTLIAIWGAARDSALGGIYVQLFDSGAYELEEEIVYNANKIFNEEFRSIFIFKSIFIILYAVFIMIFTNYIANKMETYEKVVPKLLCIRHTINILLLCTSHCMFAGENFLTIFLGYIIISLVPYLVILIPNIIYFNKRKGIFIITNNQCKLYSTDEADDDKYIYYDENGNISEIPTNHRVRKN